MNEWASNRINSGWQLRSASLPARVDAERDVATTLKKGQEKQTWFQV